MRTKKKGNTGNKKKNSKIYKGLMKLRKFLLIILALFIILAGVFSGIAYLDLKPTKGRKIQTYSFPQTALLVIDMQEDFTGPNAKKPFKDAERIIKTANYLLAQAQARKMTVVYIRNVIENPFISYIAGGVTKPDTDGSQMDKRLIMVDGAETFVKTRPDAFSVEEFDSYLREQHVDSLLVVGLDAAYCVNATMHGALNRGYKVTVYKEGVATESGINVDSLCNKWMNEGVNVKSGADL